MPTGRNRHSGEGRNPEGRGEWPDVFIPLYGLMKAIVILSRSGAQAKNLTTLTVDWSGVASRFALSMTGCLSSGNTFENTLYDSIFDTPVCETRGSSPGA